MADLTTCRAHVLAFLLNLADGPVVDEPIEPCPDEPTFITTVERGAGAYAAVCVRHQGFLALDHGHVRSVPIAVRT